jgi:hypothetical protein
MSFSPENTVGLSFDVSDFYPMLLDRLLKRRGFHFSMCERGGHLWRSFPVSRPCARWLQW